MTSWIERRRLISQPIYNHWPIFSSSKSFTDVLWTSWSDLHNRRHHRRHHRHHHRHLTSSSPSSSLLARACRRVESAKACKDDYHLIGHFDDFIFHISPLSFLFFSLFFTFDFVNNLDLQQLSPPPSVFAVPFLLTTNIKRTNSREICFSIRQSNSIGRIQSTGRQTSSSKKWPKLMISRLMKKDRVKSTALRHTES